MKRIRPLFSTVSTLAAILISGSVSGENPQVTDPQIASVAVAANEIEEVLNTIKNVLIPQTKNAELKSFLEKFIPVVQTHPEHAEMIEKLLS